MARAQRAEGGKVMSYTNTPNNVEEEAAGKRRADGGATPAATAARADGGAAPAPRAKGGAAPAPARADGGATSVTARAEGGRLADGGEAAAAVMAPKKRARGGALKNLEMEGMKSKHRRLDRPGRKRGGGVGADMTPLTTAAHTTQAGDHKVENDELAR